MTRDLRDIYPWYDDLEEVSSQAARNSAEIWNEISDINSRLTKAEDGCTQDDWDQIWSYHDELERRIAKLEGIQAEAAREEICVLREQIARLTASIDELRDALEELEDDMRNHVADLNNKINMVG